MISHYDQKDFVTLYPGVYTEKEKALVDQYLADNRALEERGDVDARALIKGTLPEDTPGLGPSFAVTEAMVRYNNEKYDPENPVLNDPGYARSLGYEDVVAMSCFGAHDDTFNERGNPPLCQVYAALGREKEYEVKPATQEKRVMVVGGGPAGMETAVIAALRGQQVLLYEKEPKLGGSLPLAALVRASTGKIPWPSSTTTRPTCQAACRDEAGPRGQSLSGRRGQPGRADHRWRWDP